MTCSLNLKLDHHYSPLKVSYYSDVITLLHAQLATIRGIYQ